MELSEAQDPSLDLTDDGRTDAEVGGDHAFASTAGKLAEDIEAAARRVGDAGHDLATLVQGLVSAGKELEAKLSLQRELGAASLKAVDEARNAASAASEAAAQARESEVGARELREQTAKEYGTVSWLVENLQQRIAALSVLASPLPRGSGEEQEHPESDANMELRVAS